MVAWDSQPLAPQQQLLRSFPSSVPPRPFSAFAYLSASTTHCRCEKYMQYLIPKMQNLYKTNKYLSYRYLKHHHASTKLSRWGTFYSSSSNVLSCHSENTFPCHRRLSLSKLLSLAFSLCPFWRQRLPSSSCWSHQQRGLGAFSSEGSPRQ